MEQRAEKEDHGGHLPTGLKGLDEALCGGIPFGVLTELVGPAGIGKTQVKLVLSISVFREVGCRNKLGDNSALFFSLVGF